MQHPCTRPPAHVVVSRGVVFRVYCWSLCVFARSDLPYTAPYDQPWQCSCLACESVFTSQHVSRRIACAHMFPCHGTSCLSWSGLCLHAIVKTLTRVRLLEYLGHLHDVVHCFCKSRTSGSVLSARSRSRTCQLPLPRLPTCRRRKP